MFAEFLDSLPIIEIESEPEPFNINDAIGAHHSFSIESPEAWILFLTKRPDLSLADRDSVLKIIERLWRNQNNALAKEMLAWGKEETKSE